MTSKFTVKRPLFVFCMTFFAVSILTAGVGVKVKISVILTCAVLGVLLLTVGIAVRKRLLAVGAVLLVLFPVLLSLALGIFTSDRSLSLAGSFDGVNGEAKLTVEQVRHSSSYYGYYTAHLHKNGIFPDMKVSLSFPDGSCEVGDVLLGNITLHTLTDSSSFDEKTYFLPDGILMSAEADALELVGHDTSFSVSRYFSRLNDKLCSRIRVASGRGDLICAVLLGRRDLLADSVKRDFSRIGISHLLALSGIHLSLAVAALELILDKVHTKKSRKTAVLCLSILFYMSLVGFTKSVTRAGIMHLIRYSGHFLRRRSDGMTSLGVAAFLIIIFDPFAVYDTGFVLSVLAAYACIVYASHTKSRKRVTIWYQRILRSVSDTVKLTLLITALTLPVLWKVFGQISLISPLTNVFFIPAVSFFLYLSFIYLILCTTPVISYPLTLLVDRSEELISGFAERISLFRHICVSLNRQGAGFCCALLFLAVLIATVIYKRKRTVAVLSVALCTILLAGCLVLGYTVDNGSCELELVTSGKNECFALRNGNGFILIDVSDGSSGISRTLTVAAEEMGAVEISALVLTHLHRRHIASVSALADNVMLRYAYIPKAETDSDAEVAEALREIFKKRGIVYAEYSRNGDSITHDGVTVDFPTYTLLSRSTHPIVTFFFTLGDRRFCYLGSSFEESSLADESIRNADILFFGAHPPVRKKETLIITEGKAVLSYRANEKELLFVDAEGGVTVLGDSEVYRSDLIER